MFVTKADAMAGDDHPNQDQIDAFRAHGGRLPHAPDVPALVLTTTGRKTGKPRSALMTYSLDGDVPVVIAANGGADDHPAWYLNLVANPAVTVETGTDEFAAVAEIASGEERERLFALRVAERPNFGIWQAGTSRALPVIRLVRSD